MMAFSVMTLLALSNVSHKEERFMSAIFPLFAVTTSFFLMKVEAIIPKGKARRVIMRGFITFLIYKECTQMIP